MNYPDDQTWQFKPNGTCTINDLNINCILSFS